MIKFQMIDEKTGEIFHSGTVKTKKSLIDIFPSLGDRLSTITIRMLKNGNFYFRLNGDIFPYVVCVFV